MFKIFIGNVNFKTTEDQLRKVFEPHMTIEDLVIARDPETGQSKGYGFVMTRDEQQGREAMEKIGKFFMDNRLVYLREAGGKNRPRRKPKRRPSNRPQNSRRRPYPRSGGSGPRHDLNPTIIKPNVTGYTRDSDNTSNTEANRPQGDSR